jgi:hypothetical protein
MIQNVTIPEWTQIGKNKVRQQVTIIPRSTYMNQGPGPTDVVPAMLTPGEMVMPREAVAAAGGPQGVQQAINQRIAPRGITLGGNPKLVGEDFAPQGAQPAGYSSECMARGVRGYSSVPVYRDPLGGVPQTYSLSGNGSAQTTTQPQAATSANQTGITSNSPTGISSAPAATGITIPKATQPAAQTATAISIQPASNATRGIVKPQTNYVENQLSNPFYTNVRQNTMEEMQKQRAAQNVLQNQQLAEAGISPTSAIGRVGIAEQNVAAENAAGQAIEGINEQAMQNVHEDALNSANAMIQAGDYAGANQILSNVGSPTIDFSKVEDAKRSENLIGIATSLEDVAKNMAPGETRNAILKQAAQSRLHAYQLVGGTDYDLGAIQSAFDQYGSGDVESPEVKELFGHVIPTVIDYFSNSQEGVSAMKDIKLSPKALAVVQAAMNGDEDAAETFGAIAGAIYNRNTIGSEGLGESDTQILKDYDLYRTTNQLTGADRIELADDELVGKADKLKRKGVRNDIFQLDKLEVAYANKKKVMIDGIEYTITNRKKHEDTPRGVLGIGAEWRYTTYTLEAPDGNKKTISTKNGVITLK